MSLAEFEANGLINSKSKVFDQLALIKLGRFIPSSLKL